MPARLEPISPDDDLYRRIVPDNVTNGELNAGAYSLRPGEETLSVDIARLTSPEECLARAGRTDLGLAVVIVSDVIALGLVVEHDPVRAKLARASVILIMPERRG